jgi:hypothetical protein
MLQRWMLVEALLLRAARQPGGYPLPLRSHRRKRATWPFRALAQLPEENQMGRYRQGRPLSPRLLAVETRGPTAERGCDMVLFLEIFILNSVLEWFFACRCRRMCRAPSLLSRHDFTAFHVPGPAWNQTKHGVVVSLGQRVLQRAVRHDVTSRLCLQRAIRRVRAVVTCGCVVQDGPESIATMALHRQRSGN